MPAPIYDGTLTQGKKLYRMRLTSDGAASALREVAQDPPKGIWFEAGSRKIKSKCLMTLGPQDLCKAA